MISIKDNETVLENIKWELEVHFLKLNNGRYDYIIESKNCLNSFVDSKKDNNTIKIILNQEQELTEFFSKNNLQKYSLIAKNKEIIKERVFLPNLANYLDIEVIPYDDNKAKFLFTFHPKATKVNSKEPEGLERYQHLLENSSDLISIIDEKGNQLFVAHKSGNILGYTEAESLSINCFDHIRPSDLPLVMEKLTEVKSEFNKTVSFACSLVKKDTTHLRVEIKAKNCFNIKSINGIIIHVNDISNKETITDKLDFGLDNSDNNSKIQLGDLINIDELNNLMNIFQKFTNVPIIIVDLEGKILTSINMTDICTQFHRINPHSSKRCIKSDISLTKNLKKDEIRFYKCLNNLNDLVSPIYIGDKHIANFFVGQFFFTDEVIDYDFFKKQANDFNYNEEDYFEALDKVPRVDRDQVMLIISYYRDLIKIITTLAHSKINLLQLNNTVEVREEKLKQITDNMTDIVMTADFNFNITYVSPSIEKLTGYSQEEYQSLSMEDRYPLLAIKEIKESIAYELEQETKNSDKNRTNINELVLYTKNRKMIFTSIHSKFIRDNQNKPIAIIANIRNITKQKIVEFELAKQLNFQYLLNTIAVKYINIPTQDIDSSINDSLAQLAEFTNSERAYIFKYDWGNNFGINTYEWATKEFPPISSEFKKIHLGDYDYWVNTHKKGDTILINDLTAMNEYPFIKEKLGSQGIKSLIAIPLMKKGDCVGFIGFESRKMKNNYSKSEQTILSIFAELLVNINNRTQLEKDLQEEREKALNSDVLKSNLLKNISHEFRTPLNGIIGFSELLQQKSSNFENGNMASMIYSSAIRLNHVLDSIMLLTQLETINRKKSIDLKTTNISKLLIEINSLFKEQFNEKGLTFTVKIEPNLYGILDNKLLSQALIQLLNNAYKFTHSGGVKLLCSAQDEKIQLQIIDSGIGIPQESLNIIFSEFRQASEGYNRAYEGVGLGLSIAKKIITLMNGQISVQSKILSGSTFTIELPLSCPEESESGKSSPASESLPPKIDLRKPKVLIVEDNVINQKLIISILKDDFITDLAVNGEVAILLAGKKKYDTILMDIHLGEGIDGLATARAIKSNNRNITTPIIAVTGYTMYGDKEKILAEGCNYYLGKPYKKKELLDMINRAVSSR